MTPTGQFSPLRYPGGKGKIARYVAEVIRQNSVHDGHYVEPFAGGASVACELLLTGVVKTIHINDLNYPVHCFWKSILEDTERFLSMLSDIPLTLETWDSQKYIFRNFEKFSDLEVGFAFFFLNRTNRSGILNGGVIGGRSQTGKWLIDARFNKKNLRSRIENIAMKRDCITNTNLDAKKLINLFAKKWDKSAFCYFDPPYFEKGRQLYYDYFEEDDHKDLCNAIRKIENCHWIVTYDNVDHIRELYQEIQFIEYLIAYSARATKKGSEAMFFGPITKIPSTELLEMI